ncbi:NAD(P)/FAD-dependent oxidoreductase [Niameybacter massiliensis]|uniref:NAD(P)/FAD-dependent oxidoreductase n=1 Tax=Holtiella tumoricola TaxID=3018743 RepID=A0AA42J212_9FIRM|nr:NAD(P)/FAD-dependent oxidoreductase [Holtiella tumoricola]MDA3732995.1 NAD(P)/FAD-dependent oxidoreductase [Holtiella tumoricola]
MYDVIIIGAGVCGASIARELSKYEVNVAVVEKNNDLASGTTKANSGIVHAGYDPEPGTLMAKYNVEGNKLIEVLCKDLDVPYKKVGSLVLAFDEKDLLHLQKLYERGVENGVPGLKLLTKEEVLEKEPSINKEIHGALYAPSAGVVGPYELAIALMDNAVENGTKVFLNHEVVNIHQEQDKFKVEVKTAKETKVMEARYVINAAGLHADDVYNMIEPTDFHIIANKGQYYLLDQAQGGLVSHVIFQCPTAKGKGVLVSPTAHGNLIIGPDAADASAKHDVATSQGGLDYVRQMAALTCSNIVYRDNIRNFSGNRALTNRDEFIIGPAKTNAHFINVAGIKSPGLTSAPAIAVDIVKMLEDSGLSLAAKAEFKGTRKVKSLEKLTKEELQALIKENPAYGRIICRCEKITEGEIVEAIHSPVPATTVEAVKRRVRAGAGRCQGGFCSPKVVEIIARELNIPLEAVRQEDLDSYILIGKTNKGGVDHE